MAQDGIRDWGARGKTVLVSGHILHEVELMTREVVLMTAGKVMASGNIHEIRRLMDAHPHHILISTPEPRKLAGHLLEQEDLHSISFSEELSEVELETRGPDTPISTSPRSSYFKHLQHLVPVMVDDLHGELARFWLVERPAHRAVQTAFPHYALLHTSREGLCDLSSRGVFRRIYEISNSVIEQSDSRVHPSPTPSLPAETLAQEAPRLLGLRLDVYPSSDGMIVWYGVKKFLVRLEHKSR